MRVGTRRVKRAIAVLASHADHRKFSREIDHSFEYRFLTAHRFPCGLRLFERRHAILTLPVITKPGGLKNRRTEARHNAPQIVFSKNGLEARHGKAVF